MHLLRCMNGALVALALAAPAGAPASPAPSPPPLLTGGDLSYLAREEQLGAVYKDHGRPQDALLILKAHGCNLVRLRLWVDPGGPGGRHDRWDDLNDLPYTLALGRRVKRAGLKLLLDLHYSDGWADPGNQTKPAAWKGLTFEQLTRQVETYSRDVITTFRKNGALPDIVEVGNETTNGMLWPDGKVEEPNGWTQYGTLVKAGIRGVREGAAPGPAPRIMIHVANGAQPGLMRWFFGSLDAQRQGIDFDLIGLSFYPDPKTRLAGLRESLAFLARTYHKPILIAETGFPYGGVPDAEAPGWEFPPTPDGQRRFLAALIQTVRETPGGLGRGVVYWQPEWVPIPGLAQYYGKKTLFDDRFNALPALAALGGH